MSFSFVQNASSMNGCLTFTCVKRTQDGMDYVTVDTLFPFVAVSLDRAIVSADNPALTTFHTLYSDVVNLLLHTEPEREKQLIDCQT